MSKAKVERELRKHYASLTQAKRAHRRASWKTWCDWCAAVRIDPLHVTIPQATDWTLTLARRLKPDRVRAITYDVSEILLVYALSGERPHEPFRFVPRPPDLRPPRPPRPDPPSIDRTIQAFRDLKDKPRAANALWCAVGMGLNSTQISQMSAKRVHVIGGVEVAAVPHRGSSFLVPVPQELAGLQRWPFTSANGRHAMVLAERHWGATFRFPYGAVLSVHQTIADREIALEDRIPSSLVGVRRLHYSRHQSVAVCAFIRSQLGQQRTL